MSGANYIVWCKSGGNVAYTKSYDSSRGNTTPIVKNRRGEWCSHANHKKPTAWKTFDAAQRKADSLNKIDYPGYRNAVVVEIGRTDQEIDEAIRTAAPRLFNALCKAVVDPWEQEDFRAAVALLRELGVQA